MSAQSQPGPSKIAVMGAGLIGRRHIEGILAEPRTILSAVIEAVKASARSGKTIHLDEAEMRRGH
jgi:hypothetical protein